MSTNVVEFISIPALKTALGVKTLHVVRNPKTNKLFVTTETGSMVLRCEQTLDVTKPMSYIKDSTAALHEGCLINVVPTTDNFVATL